MLYGFVVIVHVFICLFLIGVILLQGGRGGLSEAMGGAAAQSLFGTGAATVLTRITTGVAFLFMATCLVLAAISNLQGRSVIEQMPISLPEALPGMLQPDATTPVPGRAPSEGLPPSGPAVIPPAPAPASPESPEAPASPEAQDAAEEPAPMAPTAEPALSQPEAAAPEAAPAEPSAPAPSAAPEREPASVP